MDTSATWKTHPWTSDCVAVQSLIVAIFYPRPIPEVTQGIKLSSSGHDGFA